MSQTIHHLIVSAPLPADLSGEEVIAALHDHGILMKVHPLTTDFTLLESTPTETLKYPHWSQPSSDDTVKTYTVSERVTFIPYIGEYGQTTVRSSQSYQNTSDGVRPMALAPAGVTAKTHLRVISSHDHTAGAEGEDKTDGQWVLQEDAQVECAWYLMPLMRGTYEDAHRDLCSRILEKISREKHAQTA